MNGSIETILRTIEVETRPRSVIDNGVQWNLGDPARYRLVLALKVALTKACGCRRKGERILYGDGYQGWRDVKEDETCDTCLRVIEILRGAT